LQQLESRYPLAPNMNGACISGSDRVQGRSGILLIIAGVNDHAEPERNRSMNRVIITTALVAMTSVGAATSASAWGSSSNDIDRTQANQAARINQGLRDGSLTRREAADLIAEQRRIQALESAAKRDGHLSRSERAEIERAQNSASRHIYQERHDSESRNRRWGWGWRSTNQDRHVSDSGNQRWGWRRWW
jgi:hypothetical protein